MGTVIGSDSGAYMGLGELAGAVIGRAYSSSDIDSAKDALSNFKDLIPDFVNTGTAELNTNAPALLDAANKALQGLAAMATAGYVPDYLRILNTSLLAGGARYQTELDESKRQQMRYNLGLNADVSVKLRNANTLAVVAGYAMGAEAAREFMWSKGFEMLERGAPLVEAARIGRENMGAQLIASAIDDYIELGNLYREIAMVNIGEASQIGAWIGELVPIWFSSQWIQNAMTTAASIL